MTCLRNDTLCVKQDVKFYSLSSSVIADRVLQYSMVPILPSDKHCGHYWFIVLHCIHAFVYCLISSAIVLVQTTCSGKQT